MTELKIKVPAELEEEMSQFPGVNWDAVIRRMLKSELDRIADLQRIVSKSKLTEKDVAELSGKVDESLARRFKEFPE